MDSKWFRVTKSHKCPICQHDSWCLIGDRSVMCMRVMSENSHTFKTGEIGYLHPLAINAAPPRPKRPERPEAPKVDIASIYASFDTASRSEVLEFSNQLGVTPSSLDALGCVWSVPHQAWAFPMRNGSNDIVGVLLRNADGRKWAVKGSKQGIFTPQATPGSDRLAIICEGPTDTAAGLSLGFYALGRPSCSGGLYDILTALKRLVIRRVVIVCDNDGPGLQGAETLQRHLQLPSTVIVLPAKDLRDYAKLGGTHQTLTNLINKQQWNQPYHNSSAAR